MNVQTARDWWELLDREALQARAKAEEPRMCNSKIGQWKEINAEMDSPRRTRRAWSDEREED